MFSHSFYTVRYQSAPELVRRLQNLKHKNSVLTKYANRMREKIEKAVEPELVTLDEEANNYQTSLIHLNAHLTFALFPKVPLSTYFGCSRWKQQKRVRLAVCAGTLSSFVAGVCI